MTDSTPPPPSPSAQPWIANYPQGIEWDTTFIPKPLYSLLDEAVQDYPDQIALDFLGKEYSYAKLGDMVDRVATGLQAFGVGVETRVGLFMPNCPQYVMAYYAVLKCGGTVVNFNPLYSTEEVSHQLRDAQVEVMFTLNLRSLYNKVKPFIDADDNPLTTMVMGYLQEAMPMGKAAAFTMLKAKEVMLPQRGEGYVTFNELLAHEPTITPPAIIPTEHMAVLQYTGGTTGLPKGAILTHYNLYTNAEQCALWMDGLEPGNEIMLAVIPFFHVFAMTVALNLGIKYGMKIIVHPNFDLKRLLDDVQNKKPTLLPGVSTLYATINNYKKIDNYDLSSIKKCISGGGPLSVEVKDQFEKITGCTLVEGYGLTESSPVTNCNPLEGENKRGSIGMPLPGTIVEILDPETFAPMPQGEVGEVCIRGPQVMKGYLNNAEETTKTLRYGRLHTGDLGKVDADGYFYIVDRLKEMIICGGYNIYPRNVEEDLYKHPAVAECAVIGIDDARRGQSIKAFIVLKDGHKAPEKSDMKDFLRQHMSAYAVPHYFEYRDELPKSPVGKILKKELVREEKAKINTQ